VGEWAAGSGDSGLGAEDAAYSQNGIPVTGNGLGVYMILLGVFLGKAFPA